MRVQHCDMALQGKMQRNGRNIQKQNTKMLQYAEYVQNSATILVKMRLAFPPVLLYHKNNDRERKQHPDL